LRVLFSREKIHLLLSHSRIPHHSEQGLGYQ
jgi:hypothetical protein